MKTYMVWTFIEEEENDEYQDTSTPKLLKTFDNEDDSRKYVNNMAAASDLYFGCRAALLTLEDDENYYKYADVVNTLKNAIKKAEE